jgi:membrane protein
MFRLPDNIKAFFAHYFGGLYNRADEHHIFLLGGGLAFSILACIVPFVLVIFSIVGNILEVASLKERFDAIISAIIPYERYSQFVKNVIASRIEEIIAYKDVAGYSGVIGLLIAASGLFSSMRTVLNTVYKMAGSLQVVIGKLKDFAMVFLVMLFFLISVAILPLLDIVKNYVGRLELLKFLRFIAIEDSLFSFFSFLIMFLLLLLLYDLVPYRRIGRKAAAVSALWAALLWEIAKELFGYYVTHVASFGRIYGAYALGVVVIFWLYYSSLVFILGAEIGQLYRDRRVAVQ